MRVVARGRYVEIATTDDDGEICAGTVEYMDRFIEEGFAFLGETPPDRPFVRYSWIPEQPGRSVARRTSDGILITSHVLVHTHELAHAVHLQAWPRSAKFLHEGFAQLIDPPSLLGIRSWNDADLDAVFEWEGAEGVLYFSGLFLVSQILVDHGMPGLRAFWHAVPPDATAAEVRQAYEKLFGEPIEVLTQPRVYVEEGTGIEYESTRLNCQLALCTGQRRDWDGDEWTAEGPRSCYDPDAIGPYSRLGDAPPVWRDYVMDPQGRHFDYYESQFEGARVYPCRLDCGGDLLLHDLYRGAPSDDPWRTDPRFRIEIHAELEDLPTDDPIEIRYEAL